MQEHLQLYAEKDNIADSLSAEKLKSIGADVVQGYEADVQSRAEWDKKNEEHMRLAAQVSEQKTTPWQGASNVKYPILTEAAIQFNARAYPALVQGNDIVKAYVVGEDHDGSKMNASIRVSKHMSYQLLQEMDDWEAGMDSLLLSMSILGCMFKKTYYCPITEMNKSELIYPKDLVVDYYTKNFKNCYRATHVLEMRAQDIKMHQVNGLYLDTPLGDAEVTQDVTKQELHGITAPVFDKSTTRKVLEQHTYLDLDEDEFEEPYIITVDLQSGEVLRIKSCYDLEESKFSPEGDVLYLKKIEYFTKYGMLPAPDGSFYDIGFGVLLGPINHTVDTTINMLIDAGHMNTLQAGFLSRNVRMKAGTQSFRPGEWKTVNTSSEDLHKGIVPLPTKEPSGVLFNLLGMMVNSGQRLASTIDSMVGENPGQNQKATTTLAVIEQGSKVFNGIHKRLYRSLKEEISKLFYLNSKYLDGDKYFNFIDPLMDMNMFVQVSANDYNPALMNILPAADANAATQQQKLVKAMALAELMATGLINEQEALFRILEAQEQPSIEKLIKQPQPPQPDIDQQTKIEQFKFDAYMRNKEFLLEVIKTQQQDVVVQTNAILVLAKAEAEEKGPQLEMYKAKLQALSKQSEGIGARAKLLEKSFEPEQESSEVEQPEQDYTGRMMNEAD